MKYLFGVLIGILLSIFCGTTVYAQYEPYVIHNFSSNVVINKDASLTVTEKIQVEFRENRHGIYRNIPVVYRSSDKTINSKLEVQAVVDEKGNRYKYTTSFSNDNVIVKIGDSDKYVYGKKEYDITYRVRNIIQRFEDYDELYWNTVGADWDTRIESADISVQSEYAQIKTIECFSGEYGSKESKCDDNIVSPQRATFLANQSLGDGKDMTIVVGVDKANKLTFTPGIMDRLKDGFPYGLAVLPIIVMAYIWFKRGRDVRFKSDNIYTEPIVKKKERVPLFAKREFLPTVYSPIDGLTPSEVGTILDEKIDIQDVVAEITELGRLGFLKIEKIDKKFAKDDYLITKLKEDNGKLRSFQKELFISLFEIGENKNEVKLSELKNKFYTKLDSFKKRLYEEMTQKYFFENPNTTRNTWGILALILVGGTSIFLLQNIAQSFTILPFIISCVLGLPTLGFAVNMPRRTPRGYALYRQIKGLAFYLDKGKWREEINEKNLFLRDMLPLAISLGVVNKLARDMQALEVAPPSYLSASTGSWGSAISGFQSTASTILVSSPSRSSGGSGFSGGSGGGFGGGGGGSW
jgi:uncharacterized membrane protein